MNKIKVVLIVCIALVYNLLIPLQPAMATELKALSTGLRCVAGTLTLLTSQQSCLLPDANRYTFVYVTLNHVGIGGAATARIVATGTSNTCAKASIELSSVNAQEAILCQPNLGAVIVANTTLPNSSSTIQSNIIVQWDPVAFSS